MLDQTDKEYIAQQIQESENRMMAYFETAIMPKFDLLADGIQNIQEKMVPMSRVEALEDDVALLKQVIRSMNQEISELKKAQGF